MPPLNSWQIMPVPPPTLPSATGPPCAASSAAKACASGDVKAVDVVEPAVIGLRHDRQLPGLPSCRAAHGIVQIASRTTPTQWVLVMPIGAVEQARLVRARMVPVISPLPLKLKKPANTDRPRCLRPRGQTTVTPVRTTRGSSAIRSLADLARPATSVMALSGPGGSVPTVMPRSRSRARPMSSLPPFRRWNLFLELHPIGLAGRERGTPGGQRPLVQRLEADERQAEIAGGAAHLAHLLVVLQQGRARRRRPALDGDGQQALPHQPAIARAGGQLLAHIAALVPVDGVQLVEAVLQQDRLLDRQVAAAVRHAEGKPQPVVVGGAAALRRHLLRAAGSPAPPAPPGGDRRRPRRRSRPGSALPRRAGRGRQAHRPRNGGRPRGRSPRPASPWRAACRG